MVINARRFKRSGAVRDGKDAEKYRAKPRYGYAGVAGRRYVQYFNCLASLSRQRAKEARCPAIDCQKTFVHLLNSDVSGRRSKT